jgi:hypothetical protein
MHALIPPITVCQEGQFAEITEFGDGPCWGLNGEQGASAQSNNTTISSVRRRVGKTGGDQRGPMDYFVVRNGQHETIQ